MNYEPMTHKEIKQLVLPDFRRRLEVLEGLVSRFENDTNTIYCDYSLIKDMTKFYAKEVEWLENLYEFFRGAKDAPEDDHHIPDFLRYLRNNKKGE